MPDNPPRLTVAEIRHRQSLGGKKSGKAKARTPAQASAAANARWRDSKIARISDALTRLAQDVRTL